MFAECISYGMGILESFKVAGIATGFNDQVVWKWEKEIYVDFFGILTSLEDVTDDRLDKVVSTHTKKRLCWWSLCSTHPSRSIQPGELLDFPF